MGHPSLPVPSAKIAAQWAEEVWKESEPIGADGAVPESFFVAFACKAIAWADQQRKSET
jgi:hypothetical protein